MITPTIPTMYFLGVTTGKSVSLRMFPAWAQRLKLGEAQLVGVDLPLNAPPDHYRAVVAHLKHDPLSRGALVTSHKINILHAARDLFDDLSDDAVLCQEVSCIYRRGDRLLAHTVDPQTSSLAMRHFIPPGYWKRTGADVLCLGGGGAAVAITAAFLTRSPAGDRPRTITLVDRSADRLTFLESLIRQFPPTGMDFRLVENEQPAPNDALLAQLPPGSLVINATGMGKDTPGSPLTDQAVFPQNGLVWELNYRGELDFQHQAQRQQTARKLHIEDGWQYFLLGWSHVISHVFDVELTPPLMTELAEAAAIVRQ